MHGQKKRRKQSIKETVTIDGVELRWELRSEPQFTTEHGYRGLRISVQTAEGTFRELVLEYPFPKARPERPNGMIAPLPQRPRLSPAVVEADIRQAIAAGWNPLSRGKPYTFHVPKSGD